MNKILKTYTIIAISAISFFGITSCNNTSSNSNTNNSGEAYSVKLELLNSAGKKIILTHLSPKQTLEADTVIIDNEGKAVFSGNVSNEELFLLHTEDNSVFSYLAINKSNNILVKGDYSNFINTYTVTGSEASNLLKQVNMHNVNANNKMLEYSSIINAEQDKLKRDSLIVVANEKLADVLKSEKNFIINFINEHPGSFASFLALQNKVLNFYVLDIEKDHDLFVYYEKVAEGLKKNNPNADYTKMIITNNLQIKSKIDAEKQANITTAIGTEAPDIAAPGLDGKTYKLSDLRGQYVLLDFWAAWCRPCRGENPNVLSSYNKYKDKGFTVYQVSLDKTKENWEKAIKDDGLGAWTHVSDLKEWQSEYARLYNISSIPTNFLINPEGKIIAKNLRGAQLSAKLSELLD